MTRTDSLELCVSSVAWGIQGPGHTYTGRTTTLSIILKSVSAVKQLAAAATHCWGTRWNNRLLARIEHNHCTHSLVTRLLAEESQRRIKSNLGKKKVTPYTKSTKLWQGKKLPKSRVVGLAQLDPCFKRRQTDLTHKSAQAHTVKDTINTDHLSFAF